MALLTVRAAAERLGVHENTVRHWEERGILRAVHLPGSGFRRFPIDEVERVAAAMRASFNAPPVARPVTPAEVGEINGVDGADGAEVAEDRFVDATYEPALAEQD
jgi:excisionase family DNA binding protein